MSSGRPTRRTGVVRSCSSTPVPRNPASALAQQWRVDEARRNGVHRDALGSELPGQRPGERDDSALGCRVVDLKWAPGLGARRGDVHDAAPPGGDHVGQHGLAAVEGPGEVDRDHPVIRGPLDLEELLEGSDAGVVDEDRRRPEPFPYLRHCVVDASPVGHIDGQAEGSSPLGPRSRSRPRRPNRCRDRARRPWRLRAQVAC